MAKKVNAATLAEMTHKGADVMLRELEKQVAAENGISMGKDNTRRNVRKLIGEAIAQQQANKTETPLTDTVVSKNPKVEVPLGTAYLTGNLPGVSSPYAAGILAQQKQQEMAQPAVSGNQTGRQQAMSDPYAAVSQAKKQLHTPEWEAEQARKAMEDYRKRQEQAAANQKIRDADLQEIRSWSNEDRALLESYIREKNERDDPFTVSNPFRFLLQNKKVADNYDPLVEKFGEKRLEELAETYGIYLTEQDAKALTEQTSQAVDSVGGAVGHNALGVGARLIGGPYAAMGRMKEAFERTGRYSTLAAYTPQDMLSLYGNTVVSETAQNIGGDEYDENGQQIKEGGTLRQIASVAYQGGIGFVDSVARAAVGGKGGALILAAANSFSQTVSEASKQGATPEQAYALGLGTAAIEAATEKIPLDEMFKAAKGGAKGAIPILKEGLRQAGIEVTTEEVSYLGNLLWEAAVLREKSTYKQKIGELVANGASYEEAKAQADKDVLNEALQTAAVSGFSGFFSGGGSALVGSLRTDSTPEVTAPVQQEVAAEAVPAAPAVEAAQQTGPSMEQLLDGVQDMTPAPAPLTEAQQHFDNAAAIANGMEPVQQAETDSGAQMAANNEDVQSPEGGQDIKGTGAAEGNFSGKPAYNATLSEDNSQADRRDDVRPMELPKQDINGGNVSAVTGDVYGSRITPDDFASLMEEPTAKGDFTYAKITNDQATQRATETIASAGTWENAYDIWKQSVSSGNAGAEMSARGALFLNHAAQQGNKQLWLETLHYMQKLGTNTAQGLQAFRIIRTLNAPDKIAFLRMSVDKMAADIKGKYGIDLEIGDNLIEAYENAETDEARDAALKNVQKTIADQIPSTFLDKWTALRYMNMLGNLKTNVRNIAGNIGSSIVYRIKDAIGAGMEAIASKVSGGKTERTKSLVVDRELLKACKEDFQQFIATVSGGGKYGERMTAADGFEQGVMDQKTVFKSNAKNQTVKAIGDTVMKPLEWYRRVTNWMMNNEHFGDEAFGRTAYARALAGYLQANGVTGSDLSKVDGALLDKARAYAIKEAQEATFRDNSALARVVTKVQKATGVVGEGIMPFTKTPANVLTRAEEFSPLGLINSTVKTIQAANGKGEVTGADVVNSWAKTLTGSALFALGAAMMDQGLLTGGPDEDEEKAAFDELNGQQNFAIQLPDGTSYTIDWLTPVAMPMFMGAQFWEIFSQDRDLTFADMEQVFTSIADPMIQMSMLQSLNDSLDNIKYSDNNLGQFLMNSAVSYLSQGLTNTLMGQIERSTEENRQTTYVDKDSNVPQWLQRQLGKASQKIPGWDYQQMDYRNAYGQTEENEGGLLYNMLSPGYISKERQDAITEELNRLREVTGENVLPQTAEKTVSYTDKNGVKHIDHNLSQKELETMQKVQGQTAAKVIDGLISSRDYAALTDEQKAAAIKMAYSYAKETAEIAAVDNHLGYSSSWMKGIKDREARTIIAKTVSSSLDDATGGLQEAWKNGWDVGTQANDLKWAYETFSQLGKIAKDKVEDSLDGMTADYVEARSEGVSHETFLDAAKLLEGITPQAGKANPRDFQKAEAIAGMKGVSEADKTLLIKQQMSESQNENLDQMLNLGYSPEQYAGVLKIYREIYDSDSKNKKEDFLKKLMDRFGMTRAQANAVYQIYK